MAPAAIVVELSTEGMLAASTLTGGNDNQSVSIGDGTFSGSFRSSAGGWSSSDWTEGE